MKITALIIILSFISIYPQVDNVSKEMVGSAYLENKSYSVLERLCDEAGGRLVGSAVNEKAMSIMKDELKSIGYDAKLEKFTIKGWARGNDEVVMETPAQRKLQAVALGYTEKTPEFIAQVVYAGQGFTDDYKTIDVKDKIVLVTQEVPKGKDAIMRYEAINIAAEQGAKAILFINDRTGFINLAGMSNFQGNPSKIPAYSLTYEEGKWLERLLDKKSDVQIKVATNSFCKDVETSNIVASIPGKVKTKIVIGAHFDSWDIGQGAVDNGVGTAVLFDAARLLKAYSPDNYYSIEFVWFNGEEFGLWGSKNYMRMHKDDSIAAMINMDMIGTPTGFNAMGFDDFMPFFEKLKSELKGFDLSTGVTSIPGTNSDHMPFMFAGIPTFEIDSHLDESMYRFYHERGDTFDKVNVKYLSDAAAVVSITVRALANNTSLNFSRRSDKEMIRLFKNYGLDKRLKKQGEWIYKEE